MKTMTGTITINTVADVTRTNAVTRLVAVMKNLSWRLERQRGRRQLTRLTAEELRDIGLTREQALKASAKHIFED